MMMVIGDEDRQIDRQYIANLHRKLHYWHGRDHPPHLTGTSPWAELQKHRQTDRQTGRQADMGGITIVHTWDRQTDRQADRQTHRQIDRQTDSGRQSQADAEHHIIQHLCNMCIGAIFHAH